jgi:hypothetical protein
MGKASGRNGNGNKRQAVKTADEKKAAEITALGKMSKWPESRPAHNSDESCNI